MPTEQPKQAGVREMHQNRLHRCIASTSSIHAARILTILIYFRRQLTACDLSVTWRSCSAKVKGSPYKQPSDAI